MPFRLRRWATIYEVVMSKLNLRCDQCGERVHRARVLLSGITLGYDCKCARNDAAAQVDYDNPFRTAGELNLNHIHDSKGQPLRVTSRRQLEAAQQEHNFVHVPTNMDRANWDSPKQQRVYRVGDHYKRKFGSESRQA